MSVFATQSDLSRGDLRLVLTNDSGYRIDPFSVKWTILTAGGSAVSGIGLPAIRAGVGDYYAPWHACARPGCHKIVWEYQLYPNNDIQKAEENFYVVSSNDSYSCKTCISSSDVSCSTFFSGSALSRGDLPVYLKTDGIPLDAYAVTWQIFNSCGCPMSPERSGIQAVVGEYYADWFVNVGSGDYSIVWKINESIDSPTESFTQNFAVISNSVNIWTSQGIYSVQACSPVSPYQGLLTNSTSCCSVSSGFAVSSSNVCSSAFSQVVCPTMPNSCCDLEIPRVVHLSLQSLPVGGAYTDQPVYNIPSRIRLITFYVKYRRNHDGGRTSVKLFWGNGTEEAQSTLIDNGFTSTSDFSQQNMFLNIYNGPIPQDDSYIIFQVETSVPGGSKTVRLLAAETGQPMIPGLIEITLTAST